MTTFYWYPKCSTCKKAKAWLDSNKIDYQTVDMVATPPSEADLKTWMEKSEYPVRRFFNTSGAHYREQNLKEIVNDFSYEEAAQRLSADGLLIKRPLIVVAEDKVLVGFKEDAYNTVLNA